jgi:prolyl-tRNA editing enzyme YbaK/EbsC (Cys-tRNA(Pro) deacylase)
MSDRALRPAAIRVRQILADMGLVTEVVEFAESTRTSAEAAAQIGCSVGQVAKSLIFRAKTSNRPVLVIASGVNRVNEKAIEAMLGEKIGKADAEFVREKTGYAIGGVAPVGHTITPVTFIDDDLLKLETIWAAAGTPSAVFPLAPQELQRITGGRVAKIAEAKPGA